MWAAAPAAAQAVVQAVPQAVAQAAAQAAAPARAASAAAPSPGAAEPAQTIVVEGRASSEAEQRRLATAGITVVGRDELDQYGDTSVLDVLQRLPGISVDGDVPRMRGMGEGYTVVLINGDLAPPGFSMDTLAPADIERIEVTKGPTAEHGGAAGVINIILRVPPKLRQREWRASAGYRDVKPQGSASLSWGDRLGDAAGPGAQTLGFQLPLSLHTWANGGTLEVQRSSRSRQGDAVQQLVTGRDEWLGHGLSFSPRLDWKMGEFESLQLQLLMQANQSDNRSWRLTQVLQGPPVNSVTDESHSDGAWQMQRANLQWQRRWANGTRVELKAGLQGTLSLSEGQGQSFNAAADPVYARQSFNSNRDSSATQGGRLRLPLAETHTLALGWDLEQRQRRELRRLLENGVERVSGSLGVPFTAEVARTRVFVQDEWAPGDGFSALVGLRLEALRIRTGDPAQAFLNTSTTLAPVFNLRHALDGPGKRLLRLGLSRSLRVPDVGTLMPRYSLNGNYEREVVNTPLAADSAGNPLLQPERATGLDLAIEQHLDGGSVLSAGVFHRRISGLIRRRIALETGADASVPVGVSRWVSRPVNYGRARSSGLELELKGTVQQLLPAAWAPTPALRLRAALSLYRSSVEQVDDPEARLEGQPPWQSTLGFDRTPDAKGGGVFGFGANFTYVPAFSTQQTDLQRVWRGAARRLDAYLLWRVDRQLQLRLAGQNLLTPHNQSRSVVEDVDGFGAQSGTSRSTAAQVTAHLVLRF